MCNAICYADAKGNTSTGRFIRGKAGSRIRTDDLLITNQLLYQLSYAGIDEGKLLSFHGAFKASSAHARIVYAICIRWHKPGPSAQFRYIGKTGARASPRGSIPSANSRNCHGSETNTAEEQAILIPKHSHFSDTRCFYPTSSFIKLFPAVSIFERQIK
jgi:hypothetical protein